MDNLILQNRLNMPIVTGTPSPVRPTPPNGNAQTPSFQQVLEEQIAQSGTLSFSKHAASRLQERGIDLAANDSIARLNEGARIAREKGLNDTLIIVDKTAFIVSVKNSTVITALSDLKGNAITNIEGTVII